MIPRKKSIRSPRVSRAARASRLALFAAAGALFIAPGTRSVPLNITVTVAQEGLTPAVLGYNSGHFMPGSNVGDWWRYSGAKDVRVWRAPARSDVIHANPGGVAGDGVTDKASFLARRLALRTNTADPEQPLDNSYIDWPYFKARMDITYGGGATGARFVTASMCAEYRRQGAEMFFQISVAPGSAENPLFPITSDSDWAGKWLLWRYYYTHVFYFGREYDVRRYSMYNEPNHPIADGGIAYEDWQMRLQLASDAAQCALADVNARYGKNLVPEIYAPTSCGTLDGSPVRVYNPIEWNVNAVNDRHKRFDGTSHPAWRSFHASNHQRYLLDPIAAATEFATIRDAIAPLTVGEPPYDFGLTEFNTSTNGAFDTNNETLDLPNHYSSFGGTLVALTRERAKFLYLFTFAQLNNNNPNYGGATQVAEVYRLFLKAAQGERPRLAFTGDTLHSGHHLLITRDDATGFVHIFAANRDTESLSLNLDLSALGLPEGNVFTVEEVSDRSHGGVVARGSVAGGGIGTLTLRPQSVALVSISARPQAPMPGDGTTMLAVPVVADAQLADGAAKNMAGGGGAAMVARSDGLTADGRSVALLKFRVPAIAPADLQVVLLDLFASTTGGVAPPGGVPTTAQAHVYGLDDDNWDEATVTWSTLTSALKQNVPPGNKIANNVVINQEGGTATILGQLVATSTPGERLVNATDFVRRQDDGFASFLIVQDHRRDVTLDPVTIPVPKPDASTPPDRIPNNTPGDTQPAGIRIVTREGATGDAHGPRLLIAASSVPTGPALVEQPLGTVVEEGAVVTLSVSTLETGDDITWQWRKDGVPIPGATGPTLTLPGALADAGIYDVIVTNHSGHVTSAEAIVVIRPAATGAPFGEAAAIVVDRDGDLYVADTAQHTLQRIAPDNRSSLFAGLSGTSGVQDGTGTAARFLEPGALSVRGGNLYVADTGNSTIRAVSPEARVSTIAGVAGAHAHADGAGGVARFDHPGGIVAATGPGADIVLYVADTGNHVIRKIAPGPAGSATPVVTTLAGKPKTEGALDGTGTQALFRAPAGIAATGTGAAT
ncbi:MAG: hypothetical protein LBC18_06390, partial [Opitutaceae bacterium]|nr:hypothetical protein [Opitutaceae bacterium]